MARRSGPKPMPTALKKLRGSLNVTYAKRDKLQYEPQPESDLDPVPPDFLTPAQRDQWLYAVSHAPRGLLKATDRDVLIMWVRAWEQYSIAVEHQCIANETAEWPLLEKTADGRFIASPYLREIDRTAQLLLRLVGELGFSPASRPRMQLIPGGAPKLIEGDPWHELSDA